MSTHAMSGTHDLMYAEHLFDAKVTAQRLGDLADLADWIAVDEAVGQAARPGKVQVQGQVSSQEVADVEWLTRLEHVRNTVCQYWPVHWPLFEACLSAYVSLLLDRVSQGVGIVLIGDSGIGKGTILEPFQAAAPTVWRDKFTPASLLSGFAGEGTTKAAVNDRALFKTVKHRALVVGDLGPILSGGDRDTRSSLYSLIPPWFDGGGLMFDTGTHGAIGAKGDYSFVMLGAKTPFDKPTWVTMSTIGPRFLFLRTARLDKGEKVHPLKYDAAKAEVHDAIGNLLNWIFEHFTPRSMPWPTLPPPVEARLTEYAELMACSQTMLTGGFEDSRVVRPTSNHLLQRLAIVVCGRALLHRRAEVDESDLGLAKRFVRGSGPGQRGRVLLALSEGLREAPQIEEQIEEKTRIPYATVQSTLLDLERVGVVQRMGRTERETRGQPSYAWGLAPEPPDPEREALRAEEE